MKSIFTLTQTPGGQYHLDARGAFGGGHSGPAGKTPEEAASYLAVAIARYGRNNREGYDLIAPEEVRAALGRMTTQHAPPTTNPAEHDPEGSAKAGRKTVVFTPDNLAWLETYRQPEEGPSFVVNAKLSRYRQAVAAAMPTLTLAEWCAIVDANNGAWLLDTPPVWLADNVADSPELAEKWNLDHAALVKKLRQLGFFQAMAVEDVIERFWKSPRLQEADPDELLREAGALIAGEDGTTQTGR